MKDKDIYTFTEKDVFYVKPEVTKQILLDTGLSPELVEELMNPPKDMGFFEIISVTPSEKK